MKRILLASDYEYWRQVLIAFAQVTFGIAWASLFLQIDIYKALVIGLNVIMSAILIIAGWLLKKRL